MPITQSAKKALRGSSKKAVFNLRRSRKMKASIKEFRALINAGKKDEAMKMLPSIYKVIDKSAKGRTIKKKTASRKKSRMSKALAKISK